MRSISKNAEGFIRLFIGFPALIFWPSKVTPRKVAEEPDVKDWPPEGETLRAFTIDGRLITYTLFCYDAEKRIVAPVPPWDFINTTHSHKQYVRNSLRKRGFTLFFEND
jgi:hypothetical protein